jgi:3-oxoacyl-[acyl-carrier-protein] synthase-3
MAGVRYRRVVIEGQAALVPPTVITTDSLERMLARTYAGLGLRPGFLELLTGIQARRFWEDGVRPSDAATRAARKVLLETGFDPRRIGALVSTSVCKDYLEPSVAALVHGNLGLRPEALNFDVGNACLGFFSGVSVVANMIELGQIEAGLVVAGEGSGEVTRSTVRKLMQPGVSMDDMRANLATLTLGSAAAAWLLVREDLATQGHRLRGLTAQAATEHSRLCVGTAEQMTTDPTTLLTEGVALAGRVWRQFCVDQGLQHANIAEYCLHQVGKANHDAVCGALQVPLDRALRVYPDIGNVGACGVPLTLSRAVEQGRVSSGDTVALLGIGSGLNCAMMALDW